ncbi:MAG: GTP-binding protein [Gallionella sp.]|jgi:peptide chain release factor subunit 3
MASVIKFVFVGHVDAGKSSTSGHLLYKSGCIDDRTMESMKRKADSNKRKGCEFAYLLDKDEEEQTNGRTVDYDLVPFTYQQQDYILVDCPGHKAYVRNLIAGLNATRPSETIGCLMISLAEGEYEAGMNGGQTQEAVLLLRATGVQDLVVVMNKIDLVAQDTPRYSKILGELQLHLKKLGFQSLHFHPASGYVGTGLVELLALLKKVARPETTTTTPSLITPTKQVKIQARLMFTEDYTLLFSAGLSLVIHVGSVEYQVTVESLIDVVKKKKVPFALNGSVILAGVSCDDTFRVSVGDRIILRKDDHTIGFGVVKG